MNEDPPIEESAPEESASGASDTVVPSSSDKADLGQSGKLTGTVLGGRYELRSEIGRGGMGAIYLARDLETEDESASLVAVKVLLQQIGEEEQSRNRFLLEARAVSSLAHPGVVKVKEYSITSDGMPYIVINIREITEEKGGYSGDDAGRIQVENIANLPFQELYKKRFRCLKRSI
ncbi:MAG: protein kinase [Cyanobacteriota/Melainabacteria group bacterium]